jgi:N-acetylglucosaminyl-diphospho-decaprenol L-rhamnosyltransferase
MPAAPARGAGCGSDSDDGSVAIAQRHALADPRVRFIANPDNPGFATACNQGAQDCDASWLAFINPDLMVEPQTLAQLRELGTPLGDCLLGVEQVDEAGQADAAVRRRDPDFAAMLRHPGRCPPIPRNRCRWYRRCPVRCC